MAYGSGLLVICAPGDVEVYFDCLLVRKVIVVQVYWLHVHQVTLRFSQGLYYVCYVSYS